MPDPTATSASVLRPQDGAFFRWLAGALLLLAIGVVLQLGLLVYAMYALVGMLVLSRFLAREWIERLNARRRCSQPSVEVGQFVTVSVNVKNSGWMPVPWILMEDSLPASALQQRPPRIRLDGRRSAIVMLGPGGTARLEYQVQFLMRGYYQIGPLLYESGDLFGLHRRYRIAAEPVFVLVPPKVVPLIGYDLASRRPVGEVRMTHRLFEDPTRISGVRQYQNGDPFNRIHWRATARTGTLHCKTYEPSTVAGMTLVLDFHQATWPATREPVASELAITACASLAHAVYQLGQQFGLVTNGRDAADRVRQEGYRHEFRTREVALAEAGKELRSERLRPVVVDTRRGAEQFQRLLETLARAELTDGLTLPDLLAETASRLPRDATVTVVLSEVLPESAMALGNLRRQGFAITAVMVLPDDARYPEMAGRLLAEGLDVRRIDNEAALMNLCSQQMVGAAR